MGWDNPNYNVEMLSASFIALVTIATGLNGMLRGAAFWPLLSFVAPAAPP